MTQIFAYHTDDGAPMNETALCEEHAYGGFLEHVTGMLAGAEDAPAVLDYREVERPEDNGTECIECGRPRAKVCDCGNYLKDEPEDATKCQWCMEAEYVQEMKDADDDHCTVERQWLSGEPICTRCSKWCDCLVCTRQDKEERP